MKSGKPSHRRKKRWCGGFFSSLGEIFELLILYQKDKLGMNCQNLMKLFISFVGGIFCLAKRKYFMGQSMMFSYGNMLAKLKKEIMNPEEGVTGHLLDFFMKTRADELEIELIEQNQQYREAIDEIKKYEEEIQKLNLPKAVRVQIDRYVSAVNWRWVLCWDFLYRSGMKDILLLIEKR